MFDIAKKIRKPKTAAIVILAVFTLGSSQIMKIREHEQGVLEIKPFDPHIKQFSCQMEATKVPPIDAQADD
ncbi:hypothetical protein [Massilia sp. TS11]|uniref:hypothetical protein n=1 Tax=Massilia sp. TS11 TaxID=2908003 RepID=UPI001EDAFA40|nr:hypothetical protein [Massilia sp. TS11]MCG2583667.1 hypothetical protein [Massilia sp. TS11]